MFKSIVILCYSLSLLCLPLSALEVETSNHSQIKIGVLAKRGEARVFQRWQKTADYLNQTIPDHQFKIIPMPFDDIPVLVKHAMVEFVIVNPGIFVDLSVRFGARRLLTMKNAFVADAHVSQFGSVIFTRADHAYLQNLKDLAGQRVAAVHPTSLGGWIMALREFKHQHIDQADFQSLAFFETHDHVVRAVLSHQADVGIIRTDILERLVAETDFELTQIHILNPQAHESFPFLSSSILYPEWPIASLPHTSEALSKQVAIALLNLDADSPANLAADIGGWTIPENYQTVHDCLQDLELPPYESFHEVNFSDALKTYGYWVLLFLSVLIVLIWLLWKNKRLNQVLCHQQIHLKHSEERFRATFAQAAVGLAYASALGHIQRVNRKYCEMSGYTEAELQRLNLSDLTLGDGAAEEIAQFERLKRGEITHFSVQRQHRRKNTETFWILLSISWIKALDRKEHHLVAVINDIDALKQLEAQMREQEREKELILNIAGDGILGLDKEGLHTFVNPAAARLLGYSPEELIGTHSHQTWHHSKADGSPYPEADCPITGVLQEGRVHRSQAETFWDKNGQAVRVNYISTPIIVDGDITGAVLVFHEHNPG